MQEGSSSHLFSPLKLRTLISQCWYLSILKTRCYNIKVWNTFHLHFKFQHFLYVLIFRVVSETLTSAFLYFHVFYLSDLLCKKALQQFFSFFFLISLTFIPPCLAVHLSLMEQQVQVQCILQLLIQALFKPFLYFIVHITLLLISCRRMGSTKYP